MRLMIIFINKTSIKLLRSSNTILIKIPKRLKPISIIGLMIQPLEEFKLKLSYIREMKIIEKSEIVNLFKLCLPDFLHEEKGKYLDDKM